MSVGEAQGAACARLAHLGESAAFDAGRLLEEVTGRNRAWLLAHDDETLEPQAKARFETLLTRRAAGEPLAYVLGRAGFYGRSFAVTPDVLVPRPESEQLVELAMAFVARHAGSLPLRIADVGTGSGVLAITLALELPGARVTALDASSAALALAERNACAHGVSERIAFVRGDAFEGLAPSLRFDLVVANLPYVRTADLALPPDPTSFEPRVALDGGPDGLDVYRRLFALASEHVVRPARLLLEAGPDTASALAALAEEAFAAAARVTVERDYAGLERVVSVDVE
ncbi:MAG: peptide chain release factor N(5)-glutamine methyltransferase [Vulcanimicrobiaceae bacterium]